MRDCPGWSSPMFTSAWSASGWGPCGWTFWGASGQSLESAHVMALRLRLRLLPGSTLGHRSSLLTSAQCSGAGTALQTCRRSTVNLEIETGLEACSATTLETGMMPLTHTMLLVTAACYLVGTDQISTACKTCRALDNQMYPRAIPTDYREAGIRLERRRTPLNFVLAHAALIGR